MTEELPKDISESSLETVEIEISGAEMAVAFRRYSEVPFEHLDEDDWRRILGLLEGAAKIVEKIP